MVICASPRNGHLGADVAKLGERGVKQAVLLPHRRALGIGMSFLGLELHVGIGDFGDDGHVEDKGQHEYETGDREVDPLYVLQGLLVREGEEDIGTEDGGDNGTDAVKRLGGVDSDLRILWGSAD